MTRVNGDLIAGVEARLDRDVLTRAGDAAVVLEVVTNDLGGASAQTVNSGLERAQRLRAEASPSSVDFDTACRTCLQHADSQCSPRDRESLDPVVALFVGVLDIARSVGAGDHAKMMDRYDSGDGLHPTRAGYRRIAQDAIITLFRRLATA